MTPLLSDPFPNDPDAERQLVGCLLADPSIEPDLPAEQLFDANCRNLYSILLAMKADGDGICPENMCNRLARSPLPFDDNGAQFVTDLVNEVRSWPPDSEAGPYAARFDTAARHINECHVRRKIIRNLTAAPLLAELRTCAIENILPLLDFSDLTEDLRQQKIPVQSLAEFKQARAAERQKNGTKKFLIPGVLAAGEPGVIVGPKSCMKTAFAMDLLISVATGTKFLNKFDVAETGPTLLITGETTDMELENVADRICESRQIDPNSVKNFSIATELPNLDNAIYLARLRALIAQKQLKVLALDPSNLVLPDKGGSQNAAKTRELLKAIAKLSRSTGCSILFVHDTRRDAPNPEWPTDFLELAQGPLAEFAAQSIQISRRERSEPQTGNHVFWMTFGGSAIPQGSIWAVDVEQGDDPLFGYHWWIHVDIPNRARLESYGRRQLIQEERRERRESELLPHYRQRIIKVLVQDEYHLGATSTTLRGLLSCSGTRINNVLTWMIETNKVEINNTLTGRGKAPLYRLTKDYLYLCQMPAYSPPRGETTEADRTIDVREADINGAGEQENRGAGDGTNADEFRLAQDPVPAVT